MLLKEQVDQLFAFCEKHFVRFYDVQVELVDHLANAIEEKMIADKKISFEQALGQVYLGFGAMGFAGFVSSRSRLIEKQYRSMKWKLFRSYFTMPKIALTFFLFVLLSFPQRFLDSEELSIYLMVLMFAISGYEFYIFESVRRRVKKVNKPLMLIGFSYEHGFLVSSVYLQFSISNRISKYSAGSPASLLFFEIIVLFGLVVLIGVLAYRETADKLFVVAEKDYPEVFA